MQKSFFSSLSKRGSIHYFGMFLEAPKDHPDRAFFDRLQAAMYFSGDAFKTELPRLKTALAAAEERSDSSLPMVLSNEHFTLSSYSTREPGVTIRAAETAYRLALVLDEYDVRLLFGVRRQDAMIRALFVEAAARTHHNNARHFDDLGDFIALSIEDGSLFNAMFDFSATIHNYEKAFPAAKVEFYTHETFTSNQKRLLRSICDLVGIPEAELEYIEQPLPYLNVKQKVEGGAEVGQESAVAKLARSVPGGAALTNLLRRSNTLRSMNDIIRPKRVIPDLTETQSKAIMETFASSNAALAARHPEFGKTLVEFGYATASTSSGAAAG